LATLASAIEPELFYAIEVRLIDNDMLVVHEPISDAIKLVKHLSAADLNLLRSALRLMAQPDKPSHSGPIIFIMGCFARNDLLFGARGYRRTLLEAGTVAQHILNQANQLGIGTSLLYEFADRDVDSVLETDGVEDASLVALELKGNADVS